MKPLCFVLMPFGQKTAGNGTIIDFDAIYGQIIRPAIIAADLQPLRADEEKNGGIIHKPMFERLLLCAYAVADLTTANANVFYELGIRHAAKGRSTVLCFAKGVDRMPFDIRDLRALPYRLTDDGLPVDAEADVAALAQRLRDARADDLDSPIYQLVENYPDIAHEKTDVFRDQVEYELGLKTELAERRAQGPAALAEFEAELGTFEDQEAGILVDLLLSYRAVEDWPRMVSLAERLPRHIAGTVLVREQYAFALNRDKQHDKARKVLEDVLADRGPSSETYGLLGRVYKDMWEKADLPALKKGYLKQALAAYREGFAADMRDTYPGINAVTLMELTDPPLAEEQAAMLPVVQYAVAQRLTGAPDYWDHATRLELAVLDRDDAAALDALSDALPAIREIWEPDTTSKNLGYIRDARAARGEQTGIVSDIIDALQAARSALAENQAR